MTDTPSIVPFDGAITAVIQLRSTYDKFMNEIDPLIEELDAVVKAQGIEIAGPFFVRYHKMDQDGLDFEVGVVVKTPVQEEKKVMPSTIPAYKRVVRAVHKGVYEKIQETWKAFFEWIEAEKLPRNPDPAWEFYIVHPDMTANTEEWVTEIYNPIGD